MTVRSRLRSIHRCGGRCGRADTGTPRPGVVAALLPALAILQTDSMTDAMDVFASYFEDTDNNNLGGCPETSLNTPAIQVACPYRSPVRHRFGRRTAVALYDRDSLFYEPREKPQSSADPQRRPWRRNARATRAETTCRRPCSNLATKLTQCSATCSALLRTCWNPRAGTRLIRVNCGTDRRAQPVPAAAPS